MGHHRLPRLIYRINLILITFTFSIDFTFTRRSREKETSCPRDQTISKCLESEAIRTRFRLLPNCDKTAGTKRRKMLLHWTAVFCHHHSVKPCKSISVLFSGPPWKQQENPTGARELELGVFELPCTPLQETVGGDVACKLDGSSYSFAKLEH